MIDTLVVIATNRGASRVRKFLEARDRLYPILVVDTGTPDNDPEFSALRVDVNVAERYEGVLGVVQTPYRGYDTGAYLWAYWTHPAKHYLFLQDSLTPRQADYVEPFKKLMPRTDGAVAWSGFKMGWDSQEQADTIQWLYGSDMPARGIFGPIFFTSHTALDTLRDRGFLPMPPHNKMMAMGCERAWAIGYHRAKMHVALMHPEHNRPLMEAGKFHVFTKQFGARA